MLHDNRIARRKQVGLAVLALLASSLAVAALVILRVRASSPSAAAPATVFTRVNDTATAGKPRAAPTRAHALSAAVPQPTAAPTPEDPAVNATALLDKLRHSHDDAKLLHDAEQLSIQECMAERGFEYRPEPFDDSAERDAEFSRIPRGDPDAAKAVGYGLADSLAQRAPYAAGSNNELRGQLSAADRQRWDEALGGSEVPLEQDLQSSTSSAELGVVRWDDRTTLAWDRRSCAARATRELHGDDVAYSAFEPARAGLERELESAIEEDAAYAAARERWRGCMHSGGFDYERPGEPEEKLRDEVTAGSLTAEQLREREVHVASADAQCYQRAGLAAAHTAANARVEPAIADRHRDQLAALLEQHERSVANAHEWLDARASEP